MVVATKVKPKVIVEATPSTPERLIRDPGFAKRLASAADGHPHCPPMHHGRLSWVEEQLKTRFREKVSMESVRKWFAGETKPRPDKIAHLAELFGVDVSWLQFGQESNMTPRERKQRGAAVDGAVNVVAGLIQLDGGHPAYSTEEGSIDLHAIIKGAKYDFNVALVTDKGTFQVPLDYEKVIVLGVTRDGFAFDVYEITAEAVEAHGQRRQGVIEVDVPIDTLRKIESFSQRI